eukprot:GFKZ01007188.1.p1 GENE.GFKZ01007188.1~~GFKZ01007188.1.p1  ORF type:complete len:282 (-),score=33.13 GFKZ01007188.1:133-978(-)
MAQIPDPNSNSAFPPPLPFLKSSRFLSKYDLSNRVAVITGGGSGIGLSCALALSSVGAHVIILGRSADKLAGALETLHEHNASAESHVLDVQDAGAIRVVADKIGAAHDMVNVLVNNAGIRQESQACGEVSDDTFDNVMRTNLYGAYWCTQAFLPYIRKASKGRSIINIGSVSGIVAQYPQKQVGYNTSKAAMHHMSKSYALELAKENIRVNAVAPGYTRTEMVADTLAGEDGKVLLKNSVPANRAGDPDEIAQTVLHLACDAGANITGTTIASDGGYTAW